jgi:ATP-binding cassette subfamily D (ALD) protein 3
MGHAELDASFIRKGFALSATTIGIVMAVGAKRARESAKARRSLPRLLVTPGLGNNNNNSSNGNNKKPAVNGEFVKRFVRLLRILVPRVRSGEFAYTALVGVTLVVRTLCDVWMIGNGTKIERAIITRDGAAFRHYVLRYASLMLPISVVNQLLKYGLQEMTLRFRARLTEHLYDKYMQGNTFYRISTIEQSLGNVDQLLTNDVLKFCESVTELYSNLAKPVLDIVVYSIKLTGSHGVRGPLTMLLYLLLSGVVLTAMRRPLGKLTVEEQKLEGEVRFVNSRLITNAEEIAFYGGNRKEAAILSNTFKRLVHHLRTSMEFRFATGVVDNIVAKYFATVVGYYVVSRPFLARGDSFLDSLSSSAVMEYYYRSGRMLVNLASAVGRIVLAGREMTRLAGFTARVHELLERVTQMNAEGSRPFVVREDGKSELRADDGSEKDADNSAEARAARAAGRSQQLSARIAAWRHRCDERDARVTSDDPITRSPPSKGAGEVVIRKGSRIEFEHVDLVSPDGKLLVHDLSFHVDRQSNMMVTGPNGSGKSSLFRVIGGLWPLHRGKVVKPPQRDILFVPQKPYLVIGTLRDQLIYPHSVEQMRAQGITDDDLGALLGVVDPAGLILKEWAYDDVRDWSYAFSGGQKQRVAMARLFYHRPSYAILDECTSAVSDEVEDSLYQTCAALGITLFTVSHRASLRRHHDYCLSFAGGIKGEWSLTPIDKSDSTSKLTKLVDE